MADRYQSVVDYLYTSLPMFQRVGAAAFKKDLTNTYALLEALDNPHHKFKSVHVAGTNGKGSTSHMIASILQSAGYKTGLYTSPHLKDFTERIRVNGKEIEKEFVIEFVEKVKSQIELIKPSFFEITVAMAFDYFANQEVDIAVVEVGMGGRLDSTNVIQPEVSVITNIGFDHKEFLGDTLPLIAGEKAGIIKKGVPVVISERQPEVENVFATTAAKHGSSLAFASDKFSTIRNSEDHSITILEKTHLRFDHIQLPLSGNYQLRNIPGVLMAIDTLKDRGFIISEEHISIGLHHVVEQTQLKGRWQQLGESPYIFCDTGHNVDGIREVIDQINSYTFNHLYIIFGMVKDKDRHEILSLLPKQAYYYFCRASIPRALDPFILKAEADSYGLHGEVIEDVNAALTAAKEKASKNDFIFVGGSTFVVAEIDEL